MMPMKRSENRSKKGYINRNNFNPPVSLNIKVNFKICTKIHFQNLKNSRDDYEPPTAYPSIPHLEFVSSKTKKKNLQKRAHCRTKDFLVLYFLSDGTRGRWLV